MKLIRALHSIQSQHRDCVATIGNFDGIHPGHRQVILRVVDKARAEQRPACVISFEPLPHECFAGDKGPARLCNLREKVRLLTETGVDQLCILPFNQRFAAQSPEAFANAVLFDGLAVRHLIVGDDFRFGHQRRGDYALLKALGQPRGMSVEPTDTIARDGDRISSTRIREHLANANLQRAGELLERPYALVGRVAHGDKIGRTLGYPTLNLLHKHRRLPVQGAFLVQAELADGRRFYGMANAGMRPTVNGREPRFETHLFDFEGDVYGQLVRVTLLQYLRPEQRFSSIEALQETLRLDEQQARALIPSAT